ncbi:UDP-glucose 4-epimerase family protein [Marinobacter orientalis]|uniref:SDR family oxidoreductase n=1 Tax=Marinobacter orientalis TaxID=1928859 RepID=A0A7Y0WTU5_9GAMM|nr:SDR family oxidoreductase [Marinobacter orientalis]NMT65232.1 SDR family oxidoreductase [Marinobacter orientalis]TGX48000.1 SDR family oxidoreductase [Marinobacter orientalis]
MKAAKKLVVSGATGFVGSALISRIVREPHLGEALALVRSRSDTLPASIEQICLGSTGDFSRPLPLAEVDTVIHAAARVHVMNDSSDDPLTEFRRVNVEGTLALARQAAEAGVRRFVFLSSIKVNGESTEPGRAFTANDSPSPQDPYGISKMEAERALHELAAETGLEMVIIRPPLVYGPGVKGNFATMVALVRKGVPLPFGAIHNKRSLIALDNLVDLIITCIDHPAAANQTFLAGDGKDLSTAELLRRVGEAMGKPARLIPVPAGMLMFGASLLGKKAVAQRLLGSLQVDISKARNVLGWEPILSVGEGLRRCFVPGNRL